MSHPNNIRHFLEKNLNLISSLSKQINKLITTTIDNDWSRLAFIQKAFIAYKDLETANVPFAIPG